MRPMFKWKNAPIKGASPKRAEGNPRTPSSVPGKDHAGCVRLVCTTTVNTPLVFFTSPGHLCGIDSCSSSLMRGAFRRVEHPLNLTVDHRSQGHDVTKQTRGWKQGPRRPRAGMQDSRASVTYFWKGMARRFRLDGRKVRASVPWLVRSVKNLTALLAASASHFAAFEKLKLCFELASTGQKSWHVRSWPGAASMISSPGPQMQFRLWCPLRYCAVNLADPPPLSTTLAASSGRWKEFDDELMETPHDSLCSSVLNARSRASQTKPECSILWLLHDGRGLRTAAGDSAAAVFTLRFVVFFCLSFSLSLSLRLCLSRFVSLLRLDPERVVQLFALYTVAVTQQT